MSRDMEPDRTYDIESAEQFWTEIQRALSTPCATPESIDDCLRCYLALAIRYKHVYLDSDDDVAHCVHLLRTSAVFRQYEEYVRRQFIYGLLQEEESDSLHIFASVVLLDGRENEATYQTMKDEGVFPRLVELIEIFGHESHYAVLNKLFLDLIYEMARMLTLDWHDLVAVKDSFVLTLLSLIESVSSDAADPYHYCVIRVLLVINEQYMVSSSQVSQPGEPSRPPLTNRVVKAISTHASVYKTFGENLILLLNREKEAILQIQILKLLYLVFGTPSTAEYFYTNDLHVLLDVILRNLLDLPADEDDDADPQAPVSTTQGMTQALRHTYLRVLHHLLENSQLRRPGMAYKPREIRAVLVLLAGGRTGAAALHFAPMDSTTVRLAERCRAVAWLQPEHEASHEQQQHSGSSRLADAALSPVITLTTAPPLVAARAHSPVVQQHSGDSGSAASAGGGYEESARRRLGMSVGEASGSNLSMVEVATHTERPGLITPSRGLNM